jgi:hypothetical protein
MHDHLGRRNVWLGIQGPVTEAASGLSADQAAAILRDLDVDDPECAARRELDESETPEVMRQVLLRRIWNEIYLYKDTSLRNLPAGRRLLDAGANTDDLVRLAQHAAYEMAFEILYALSPSMGYVVSDDLEPLLPRAVIAELSAEGLPTGRYAYGIHECLLSADPGGEEGRFLHE